MPARSGEVHNCDEATLKAEETQLDLYLTICRIHSSILKNNTEDLGLGYFDPWR